MATLASAQRPSSVNPEPVDIEIQCKDCGQLFTWSVGEQDLYRQKGFTNSPQRCKPCREKHKAEIGAPARRFR